MRVYAMPESYAHILCLQFRISVNLRSAAENQEFQKPPVTDLVSVGDGLINIVEMTHLGFSHPPVHFHGHRLVSLQFPPSIRLLCGASQNSLMIYDPKTDPQLKSWLVKNLEPMCVLFYPPTPVLHLGF